MGLQMQFQHGLAKAARAAMHQQLQLICAQTQTGDGLRIVNGIQFFLHFGKMVAAADGASAPR